MRFFAGIIGACNKNMKVHFSKSTYSTFDLSPFLIRRANHGTVGRGLIGSSIEVWSVLFLFSPLGRVCNCEAPGDGFTFVPLVVSAEKTSGVLMDK